MGFWCSVRCNCSGDCPHSDQALVSESATLLINAGRAMARTFRPGRSYGSFQPALEAYGHLADESNYRDEELTLPQALCDLWRLELEEIRDIHMGRRHLDPEAATVWHQFWTNFFSAPQRQGDSLDDILDLGLALCDASQSSGMPIRFFL